MSTRESRWRLSHAGATATDVATYLQRAASIPALIGVCRQATILLVRPEAGAPESYLSIPESAQAPKLASQIASTLGASKDPAPEFPALDMSQMVQAVARPAREVASATQAGHGPDEVATYVVHQMPPDCWVAVTLRKPSGSELRKCRAWFRFRLPGVATHYSTARDPLLVTFTAGGPGAADFLVGLVAMVPGLDLDYQVRRIPGRLPATVGFAALGAGLPVADWAGVTQAHLPLLATTPQMLGLLAAPGLALAAVRGTGVIRSDRDRMSRSLAAARFPSPGRRKFVRKPHAERTVIQNKGTENQRTKTVAASPGDYPMPPSVFLLTAEQVISIGSPHYGASAGAGVTASRGTPPELVADIGPLIGQASGGMEPVHLSSGDAWQTVFACGEAGSGKSVLIQQLFAYDAFDKQHPSGLPGRPGAHNAMIAFESKDADGAEAYVAWSHRAGMPIELSELSDPTSVAIDLAPGATPEQRASEVLAAMVYAFGADSIQYRSQNTLRPVLEAAMLVDPDTVAAAGLDPNSSWLELADIFLSRAESAGINLYRSMENTARSMPEDDTRRGQWARVLNRLDSLFGAKVTAAQRRQETEAPRSKIAQLMTVASWFDPARPRLSWDEVLTRDLSIVINSGGSHPGGIQVDFTTSKLIGSMLLFSLQRAIERQCAGWRNQGRSVSIYSDELSLLAGRDPEVFKWLRNQGRSFGVHQFLATQYPEQLDPQLQTAVLGAGTTVWFRQQDPGVIAKAVSMLSRDGSEWSSADLATLRPHHAIVQASVHGQMIPATPVQMYYWGPGGRPVEQFANDQGVAA